MGLTPQGTHGVSCNRYVILQGKQQADEANPKGQIKPKLCLNCSVKQNKISLGEAITFPCKP
jgi:hypothetical protein